MPEPAQVSTRINAALLRAVRLDLGLSQAQFADAVRKAGAELGEPNACGKRLVQKWELGEHVTVRPNYERALAAVTGLPYTALCGHRPVAYTTLPRRLDRIIRELVSLRADLDNLE